jgi:hypothetical protein
MNLYRLEDSGAEGYACARCEDLLHGPQSFGPPDPPGSATDPRAPALRHSRIATNPIPAPFPEDGPALAGSIPGRYSSLPIPTGPLPDRRDRTQVRSAINRLLDSPPPKPDVSPHSPWIVGMKIFAWLLCMATVAGVCVWGSQAKFLRDYFQSTALFLAVLIPVAVLAGLLVVSSLMIFLNLARDVRLIRIRLCQREDER